jgi:hypothetical protein
MIASCQFNFKTSYYLLAFLLCTHIGAGILLALTPGYRLGIVGIVLSYGYYIQQHLRFIYQTNMRIQDVTRAALRGDSIVTTSVMILNFKHRATVFLCKDMLDPETFRQLRMRLKGKGEPIS